MPHNLKSMSPKKSSEPMISNKRLYSLMFPESSISVTRPTDIPATGRFSGTPASKRAIVPAHTEAIDVEPFDSITSDVTLIAYGKSS